MSAAILGMGMAVPARAIAQEAALEMARFISAPNETQERLLPVLYRRTNVRRRGSVLLEDGESGDVSRTQTFFTPASGPTDLGPGTGVRLDRYAHEAPLLGAEAATAALSESGVAPSEVTHIVTVSCTGFMAPASVRARTKRPARAPT